MREFSVDFKDDTLRNLSAALARSLNSDQGGILSLTKKVLAGVLGSTLAIGSFGLAGAATASAHTKKSKAVYEYMTGGGLGTTNPHQATYVKVDLGNGFYAAVSIASGAVLWVAYGKASPKEANAPLRIPEVGFP